MAIDNIIGNRLISVRHRRQIITELAIEPALCAVHPPGPAVKLYRARLQAISFQAINTGAIPPVKGRLQPFIANKLI
ncbi:MAG: hypothetical protein Hens3KO_21750 [Henriciella sp.]